MNCEKGCCEWTVVDGSGFHCWESQHLQNEVCGRKTDK